MRVPKFLHCFNMTIGANSNDRGLKRLVGEQTTTADLTLFQVMDGLKFAFPHLLTSLEKSSKYELVFGLYNEVAKELDGYLKSDRRRRYSKGVFRHYPELDGEIEQAEKDGK